jgi:hypothetical protein
MSEPTNDLKSACARYPSVPPLLALMYLRSDRRAAGLGALDATRRTGRTIMRYKERDLLNRRVLYTLRNKLPPRDVMPDFDFDAPICGAAAADSFVTITRLPAVDVARRVGVDERDMENRGLVARWLRQARREIASA